jgi:hypothetical protein
MYSHTVARVVLLLIVVLGVSAQHTAAVPTLSILPPSLIVQPGQKFSLNVTISDVTDLYAFGFDLAFAPDLLTATGVTEGSLLSGCGPLCFSEGIIDNTDGTITAIANTLAGPVPGVSVSDTDQGTLLTISFQAKQQLGTSSLSLSEIILLDSALNDISFASPPDPLGSVAVQQVVTTVIPEPSTWHLLITGIVGLLGYGWRRQRAA